MKVYGYTALEGYFDKPTGVGKHIEQMFRALSTTPDVDFTVLAARDQVGPDGRIPATHPLAGLPVATLPFRRRWLERRWTFLSRPVIDPWCPGADWIYCGLDRNIPKRGPRLAATIHSLYPFDPECPGYNSWNYRLGRLRYGRMFRDLAAKAELVLTVSKFLQNQIVEWLGADPAKVVIVGNGVEQEYFDIARQPRGVSGRALDRPYVVCVSGLNTLDGASYVLAAAEALQRRDPAIQVVVAGHQHEPHHLRAAAGLKNLELLGYVGKQDLARLMRDSVALLFLNRYETFGVGAAEAMAAGTPVIGTNWTAVPEIVAGAGVVVDPTRPEDVAEQIVQFARSETSREDCIKRGFARAADFTWAQCAARLLEALRRPRSG